MLKRVVRRILEEFAVMIYRQRENVAARTLPRFGNSPKNLRIDLPRRISNPEKMFIGDNVWLGPDSLLVAITRYPTEPMMHPEKGSPFRQEFNPVIRIGNRVTSTGGLQIAAMSNITIGDDVMFATNINITDGLHGYSTALEPYKYQKMIRVEPITIERGCWIGQNVIIMPGVTIGELSVIGANSVLTRSIPGRCIALGAPARVIKIWDENAGDWRRAEN